MNKLGELAGRTLEMWQADPQGFGFDWEVWLADPKCERFRLLCERPIGTLQREGLVQYGVAKGNLLWQVHEIQQSEVFTMGPLTLRGQMLTLEAAQDGPRPQWLVWAVTDGDRTAVVTVALGQFGAWEIKRKTEHGYLLATNGNTVTYADESDPDHHMAYRMDMPSGRATRVLVAQRIVAKGDWLFGETVTDGCASTVVCHPQLDREYVIPGKPQKGCLMGERLLIVVDGGNGEVATIESPHERLVVLRMSQRGNVGNVGNVVWLDELWYVRRGDRDALMRAGEVLHTGPEESMLLQRTPDNHVVCVVFDRAGHGWTAKVFDHTGHAVGGPDAEVRGCGEVSNWPHVRNSNDEPVCVTVHPDGITMLPEPDEQQVSPPFGMTDAKLVHQAGRYTVWHLATGKYAVFGPKGMCGLLSDKVLPPLFIEHGMLCWYAVNGDTVSLAYWRVNT